MKNKIFISWHDYQSMINELSEKIKRSGEVFKSVYGIPRGGLPIAVSLSHKLNLPLVLHPTKNSLVCDDVSDLGKTLRSHKDKKIACLYSSDWTEVVPDYYVRTKTDKNSWLVYPWEVEE